jgi:hypothetical protein
VKIMARKARIWGSMVEEEEEGDIIVRT